MLSAMKSVFFFLSDESEEAEPDRIDLKGETQPDDKKAWKAQLPGNLIQSFGTLTFQSLLSWKKGDSEKSRAVSLSAEPWKDRRPERQGFKGQGRSGHFVIAKQKQSHDFTALST